MLLTYQAHNTDGGVLMNLYEEIEKNKTSGYSEQNAQAKLGQDIVLKAIADSGMARNATIKGGVLSNLRPFLFMPRNHPVQFFDNHICVHTGFLTHF